ncbi:tetratricopeptide repeat protein [Melghiribacillus thermohalophilus]|uniref:Tetratricopeptide repeat protein n=1 Tax=Melghiribacillus thermohalophilus TaxID=1324956 RepID=A0A4R3N761_9BACI|nr:tetratricopeptide repeat protein [Melghiribacillus thermohalophilus]TCT25108.1 tetratricopeptide repeat protein [Melghiribacillus thermohalophilus]
MKRKHQGVVIFPKWKKQLEKSSIEALKEKKYREALAYIEKLEKFEAASNEILTGKIISLIELRRYDEAIELCQQLMENDDGDYYKYLHIYLTILFQASEYQEVIQILDDLFQQNKVPYTYEKTFNQLYELSQKFAGEHIQTGDHKNLKNIIHSLKQGSLKEQWQSLSLIRREDAIRHMEDIKPLLIDEKLNPVIKTGILQWLHEQKIDIECDVEKFGEIHRVNPGELKDILDQDFAREILFYLEELEQSNPTLLEIARQILYRFLYVLYPFLPRTNRSEIIARAVQELAMDYLNEERENESVDETLQYWKERISCFEEKYFLPLERE